MKEGNLIPDQLQLRREQLAQQIANGAEIEDPAAGYIICRNVNHLADPNILINAAEIANGLFLKYLPEELQPDKIIGVPNRGKEFATVLGTLIKKPISVGDRSREDDQNQGFDAYYDEQQDGIIIRGIASFTKPGVKYQHFLRGLRPGDNAVIVDDFSATGKIIEFYLATCNKLGIKPVFLFLIAKHFLDTNPPQIGYQTLKKQGIPAFAVVRFTGMENGKVIATAEDI